MSDDQSPLHRHIFIISDSSGSTAYTVLEAALAQFEHGPVFLRKFRGVSEPARLGQIVQSAAESQALIAYTMVAPSLRDQLITECDHLGVECIDILGPVVLHLSRWMDQEPRLTPAIRSDGSLDDGYFQRIMALDYALRHDDGRNPEGLERAQMVLVGVSRTSKTPLSVYLAYRGWMVGNIPLMLNIKPPSILFNIPPERVIGLTLRPDRLSRLRRERQERLGMVGEYDSVDHARQEIEYSNTLYQWGGWHVIDMTNRTIEDAANEIISIMKGQYAHK